METNDLLENVSMGGSEPLVTKHLMVMSYVLHAKEKQGNVMLAIHFTVKAFNQLYKMEHFSYKSGQAKLQKTGMW